MIRIICVGKIKETYLKDAIKEYEKRLSKYTKLEIIEVKDSGIEDISKCLKIEEENVNKYLKEKDYLILLDINGKSYTSIELSNHLEELEQKNANIVFLIGGSYGVSENLKKKAMENISFSKLTFPHQLFRVMLLEQLYRCYKIKNNESYHK